MCIFDMYSAVFDSISILMCRFNMFSDVCIRYLFYTYSFFMCRISKVLSTCATHRATVEQLWSNCGATVEQLWSNCGIKSRLPHILEVPHPHEIGEWEQNVTEITGVSWLFESPLFPPCCFVACVFCTSISLECRTRAMWLGHERGGAAGHSCATHPQTCVLDIELCHTPSDSTQTCVLDIELCHTPSDLCARHWVTIELCHTPSDSMSCATHPQTQWVVPHTLRRLNV